MNEIFLSYKRSDDPGYVARLADSLEKAFGTDTVYRDVDKERAGGNWKKSITRTVSGVEVVLAVIGPAWQELLGSDSSPEKDWVSFELNQARNLEVPVIPIVLAHGNFDHGQDLGDLAWLKNLQLFELTDGQGRWETDIARLAEEIANLSSLDVITEDQDHPASVSQTSHGDKSPNIASGGGDVTINFGKDSD